MSPSLTIVIPAFNRERFIAAAIDSALAQTVPAKEIIVVDDGSTDGTAEIATSYGAPVRVISIENNGAGPSRPRNVGIQSATTSHIMFLDSDDRLEPNAVARCKDVFTRCPAVGLVCGNYFTVTAGDEIERRRVRNDASTVRHIETRSVGPNEWFIEQREAYLAYCQWNYIKTPATTVPREVCFSVGGFDETLRTSNDYDFFIRVLAKYDMVYIDEPLHTIFYHTENISAANIDRPYRDEISLNHLRVLRAQLERADDPSCREALRWSIAGHLLDLAYGYRTIGSTMLSLRGYAQYISHGGAVWTGVRGMGGALLYGLKSFVAAKTGSALRGSERGG